MPTCESCGSPISKYDAVCSVCGTANPAQEPIPEALEVKMSNARGLMDTGNWRAAAKFHHEIIDQDQEIFAVYRDLGQCYVKLNLWIQAYTMMTHAARVRPGDSANHYNLGIVAVHAGKSTEEARAHLEAAQRHAETDPALDRPDFVIKRAARALRGLAG